MKTAIRVASMILIGVSAALCQTYSAINLGALRGGSTVPHAINNAGHVVGRSGHPHGSQSHAFLWMKNIRDLGSFGKGDYSIAFDINDLDQVVGYANVDDSIRAFEWTAANGLQTLPPLAGDNSAQAFGLNARGDVVGSSSGPHGVHAVIWQAGVAHLIPTLPAADSDEAFDINDAGQVVGRANIGGRGQAFLWTASSGAVGLGTLAGDTASSARHVNSKGQVVGASTGMSSIRAFVWSQGQGMQDLGTLPGGDYSQANGINTSGVVVGVSGSTLGTRAFIWDPEKGMQDLNALLAPGSNVFLAGASAINDVGQIVAWGTISHGNVKAEKVEMDHDSHAGPLHVFLLTPAK